MVGSRPLAFRRFCEALCRLTAVYDVMSRAQIFALSGQVVPVWSDIFAVTTAKTSSSISVTPNALSVGAN